MASGEAVKTLRDNTYDIAKGLAIWSVVLLHSLSACSYVIRLDALAMPLFFFVSGVFFSKRFSSADMDCSYELRSKTKRLLLPFAVWSLVSLAVNVAMQVAGGTDIAGSLSFQAYDIFFHARSVWFLMGLFLSFVIVICSYAIGRSMPRLRNAKYLVAIVIWVTVCVFVHDDANDSVLSLYKVQWLFPFLLVGCAMGKLRTDKIAAHISKFKPLDMLMVIVVVVMLAFVSSDQMFLSWYDASYDGTMLDLLLYAFGYVFAFLAVLCTISLSKRMSSLRCGPSVASIGRYSLDIYVMHMFFVKILPYTGIAALPVAAAVVVICLVSVCITVAVYMIAKLLSRFSLYAYIMR